MEPSFEQKIQNLDLPLCEIHLENRLPMQRVCAVKECSQYLGIGCFQCFQDIHQGIVHHPPNSTKHIVNLLKESFRIINNSQDQQQEVPQSQSIIQVKNQIGELANQFTEISEAAARISKELKILQSQIFPQIIAKIPQSIEQGLNNFFTEFENSKNIKDIENQVKKLQNLIQFDVVKQYEIAVFEDPVEKQNKLKLAEAKEERVKQNTERIQDFSHMILEQLLEIKNFIKDIILAQNDQIQQQVYPRPAQDVVKYEATSLQSLQLIRDHYFLTWKTTYLHVDLNSQKIGDRGLATVVECLNRYKNCDQIFLSLGENLITENGAKLLADKLVEMKKIQVLDIHFSNSWRNHNRINLGHTGAKYIANAVSTLPQLKELRLWLVWNKLEDEGARSVANALKGRNDIPTLMLDFGGNGITDSGAQAIGEAMKTWTEVKKFYLSFGDNQVGDSGAQYIAEATRTLTQVTDLHIDFYHNQTTEEACKAMCEALNCLSQVQKLLLYFTGTRIQDEELCLNLLNALQIPQKDVKV